MASFCKLSLIKVRRESKQFCEHKIKAHKLLHVKSYVPTTPKIISTFRPWGSIAHLDFRASSQRVMGTHCHFQACGHSPNHLFLYLLLVIQHVFSRVRKAS